VNHKKWTFSIRRSATPMTTAIATKRRSVIKNLIDDGFRFGNNTDRMPLLSAVSRDLNDVLGLLLDNGADPNETHPDGGNTALHAAISNDSIPAAKILLEHGGDPHLICSDVERSPFSCTVKHASIEMINFLSQHLQPGTIDFYGGYHGTALQRAASSGRKDALTLLIQHNANINLNLGAYGSALHQVSTSG